MSMKIIELRAENVKRLVAVQIVPKGEVVEITGRNAQGKSSVLDSIAYALGGKSLCPDKPIRDGETSARVIVDLGEYKVERFWSGDSSRLVVSGKDGARYPSPQRLLDTIVGRLTFDPLAFARMDAAEQYKTMIGIAGLEAQTTAMTEKIRELYDERRLLHRKADEALASFQAFPPPRGEDRPLVDVDALMRALDEACTVQQRWADAKARQSVAEAQFATCEHRLGDLSHRIERLQAELQDARVAFGKAEAEAQAATVAVLGIQLVDLDALQRQLREADETNAEIRAARSQAESREQLRQAASAAADRYTEQEHKLTQARKELTDLLATAALPVPGLQLKDGLVSLNGIPAPQLSASEALKLSMRIAMAANPHLRVLLVRDASLLDSVSLQEVKDCAASNGYQLWIERVADERSGSAILIEDGRVVE
jgi:dephospho-CoA kinase